MAKKSKNYRAAKEALTQETYTLEEACKLIPETSKVKFDASVEVHFNTGLDPKHADQILRFSTTLPNGTGKTLKVIAFVPDDMAAAAKKAGATEAGLEDLVDKVSKGWMDFDVVVAHPSVMKNIGKVAKTLGQARKMPSPKAGTIGENVTEIIADIMKGKIEVRTDKGGCIHSLIGKVSFGPDKLAENATHLLNSINENKPTGSKGVYLKSMTITTAMGPGIAIDLNTK